MRLTNARMRQKYEQVNVATMFVTHMSSDIQSQLIEKKGTCIKGETPTSTAYGDPLKGREELANVRPENILYASLPFIVLIFQGMSSFSLSLVCRLSLHVFFISLKMLILIKNSNATTPVADVLLRLLLLLVAIDCSKCNCLLAYIY